MRSKKKVFAAGTGVLALSSLIGLVITGAKINWGPFAFLHSWDGDVQKMIRDVLSATASAHCHEKRGIRRWPWQKKRP